MLSDDTVLGNDLRALHMIHMCTLCNWEALSPAAQFFTIMNGISNSGHMITVAKCHLFTKASCWKDHPKGTIQSTCLSAFWSLPTCAFSLIWILFLVPSLSMGGHLVCSGHSFICNTYVCYASVGTFVKLMMHKKFRYRIWLHFGSHSLLLFILVPKVFFRFHWVK